MSIVDELRVPDHIFNAVLYDNHRVSPADWYINEPPDKTVRKVILNGVAWDERKIAITHIVRKDYYIATCGMVMSNPSISVDDQTYRVSVFPDGVDVICFGIGNVDSCLDGHYDSVDDLPNWVKERLALLNMIPLKTPTHVVEGIGRRISSHVYWVFAPEKLDASASA